MVGIEAVITIDEAAEVNSTRQRSIWTEQEQRLRQPAELPRLRAGSVGAAAVYPAPERTASTGSMRSSQSPD